MLLLACNHDDISADQALQIISKELKYPGPVLHTINKADPKQAKQARNSSLIEQKLLTVVPEGEYTPKGQHPIEPGPNAAPYLVPAQQPQDEQFVDVRIADQALKTPHDVKIRTGKNGDIALVTFTVVYTNVTPFAVLVKQRELNKEESKTVFFTRNEAGEWHIIEKPGTLFTEFGY
ncbi:hypothetical protein SAMN05661044_00647 [Olivibacter domesticus]|uniref:Uncharacterized protein n=2 Tax=Olivibacter domesticus TaxID=407022 RepID=A0A1H7IBE0_OLID1|nr:hypothetical protein SAMN05661044_00647 [Olivibacter domesticus]